MVKICELMSEAATKAMIRDYGIKSKSSISSDVCEALAEELTKLVEDYTFSKSYRNSDQVKEKSIIAKHDRTGIEITLTFLITFTVMKKSSWITEYHLKDISLDLDSNNVLTLDEAVKIRQEQDRAKNEVLAELLKDRKKEVLEAISNINSLLDQYEPIEATPYYHNNYGDLNHKIYLYNESAVAAKALIEVD